MRLDKPHDWRTVAGTVAIALAVALLAAGFLLTIRVFLLGFAAILVAVLLRALADPLASLLQLKRGWGLLLVVLALLATIAVGGTLLGPRVAEQGEEFLEQIPAYVEAAQRRLAQSQWGRQLLRSVRGTLSGDAGSGTELLGRVTGVLALPLNALVQLFIVLVVGLYLAANPSLYTGGAIRLVPLALRPGARELVHALATTLRWFLIARVVSMLAVGLLTWLTLWALGVPLAAVLGLIAGTLTFVPYAGPMLAAIPIVLVAFTEGVSTGLWALLLYTAIQSIEGFFITPYVQERAVALPPAMTLLAEVFMGVLFGAFGVVISVPLAAAALVVVRHVYLKGLLEEPQAVQETSGRG